MHRRLWFCAVLTLLPLAGCTNDDPGPAPVVPPRPALKLVAFDSCEQLQNELRAATRASVGPYGLPGSEPVAIAEGGARTAMDSATVPQAAAAAGDPAAKSYSDTNVHEQGADEPDIVKTDGRRIVTVNNGTLSVIDAASRTRTGTLALGESAGDAKLLLAGDRALVLSSGYRMTYKRAPQGTFGVDSEVTLVDLTGSPRIISKYRGDGQLIDARQTGTVARVVLTSSPKITFKLDGSSPDEMLRDNQKTVGKAKVDAWLPDWEVTTDGKTARGQIDCGAVSRPATFSGSAVLSVLTFDLAAPALDDGSPVAVVSDGDIVYGTPDSLYIANDQRWRFVDWGGGGVADVATEPADPGTEIFKFALPPAGKPTLEATGHVPGRLLNQYAMSEWDGHLRVATTDMAQRSSAVRVLADQGDKLVQQGVVDGLGKGEQIYSVRFIGDRGYVVTFRQTDPLYSLDLSDPADPRVTGQLKITGYSAHLQPVGDNLLVGIGQEASAQGRRQGMQVSLFDVANPADPRRLDQQVVADSGSEAEYDPHAVLWWPATDLLVVPVSRYDGRSGALALKVANGSITTAASLSAPGNEPIRRTLVINDQLWTLGDSGLDVANLSTLEKVGRVAL